jgi:hypothetical protein
MERGESPQSRARVIIVSQRARGGASRATSSATLSLVPRWKSDRAVEMAAQTLKQVDRESPPAVR